MLGTGAGGIWRTRLLVFGVCVGSYGRWEVGGGMGDGMLGIGRVTPLVIFYTYGACVHGEL